MVSILSNPFASRASNVLPASYSANRVSIRLRRSSGRGALSSRALRPRVAFGHCPRTDLAPVRRRSPPPPGRGPGKAAGGVLRSTSSSSSANNMTRRHKRQLWSAVLSRPAACGAARCGACPSTRPLPEQGEDAGEPCRRTGRSRSLAHHFAARGARTLEANGFRALTTRLGRTGRRGGWGCMYTA
jgi:hypothetical protein